MASTHTFKFLSGPECEVKEFTGKHQEILTKGGDADFNKKLITCLSDIIVRVGSKVRLTEEDILKMFSADRRKVLYEARQFAMDFDTMFKFQFKYTDEKGNPASIEQEVDLSDGVPEKPFLKQWAELDEIEKDVTLILPKSGLEYQYTMLDGYGEQRGSAVPTNERSVNTAILMRNPRVLEQRTSGKLPVRDDKLHLPLKDMQALNASIRANEGRIDTEIAIKHPVTNQDVFLDMLSQAAFFLPVGSDLDAEYFHLVYGGLGGLSLEEFLNMPYGRRVRMLQLMENQKLYEQKELKKAKSSSGS